MIDEQLIERWVKKRTITRAQANKMLLDVQAAKTDARQNKLIAGASTIGALLLGIGAILWVASNWAVLPDFVKVVVLLGATFGAYAAGYVLAYEKKTFPKVGSSLLFLGALLFGASVILIAQIYNLNAFASSLVLIWLIGILPLVYALRSTPIAGLAALLFYLWVVLFMTFDSQWWFFERLAHLSFVVMSLAAIILFGIGGLHYMKPGLETIARTFRLASLKFLMIWLVFLSFNTFSQIDQWRINALVQALDPLKMPMLLLGLVAIVIALYNWLKNPAQQVTRAEGPISVLLVSYLLIFTVFPLTTNMHTIIFNIILAAIIGIMLYAGVQREDTKLLNMGVFWLFVFLILKYFDWFWNLMDRSIFFMLGGVILIGAGIYLEKKRREITKTFGGRRA